MDELIERVAQRIAAYPKLPSGPSLSSTPMQRDLPLAQRIEHTLLRPEATPNQITKLCEEALEFGFASVCVNPCFVPLCNRLLAHTPVVICTVIGFPLGATSHTARCTEAAQAITDGAREVDMVIPIGMLKAGDLQAVCASIRAIAGIAHAAEAPTKVIIETTLLTEEEKVTACLLATRAGADFVKTNSGFLGGGATVADIMLMRRVVGPHVGIKASGGIRSYAAARELIAAGADRIGTSAGVAILREATG